MTDQTPDSNDRGGARATPPGIVAILVLAVLTEALVALLLASRDRHPPRSTAAPPLARPTTPCHGVQVTPGDDIQSLINANPARTTFCFASGTYQLSGTVWTADRYPILDLRAGAVIDGQDGGFIGINGSDAPVGQSGTTILGGVFEHFGNASAPIWANPLIVRRNMVIEGTEFTENFNSGLAIQGSNARVTDVFTHHNGRYGLVVTPPCVGCPGPVGIVIEESEIAFNNTRQLPTNDDAGGTKFVYSDGMIVRANHVHDNYGSGLWWDAGNRNARVYDNVISNNRNWGILWELSYGGAKFYGNTLTGNGAGAGTPSSFTAVQLLISASDGTIGGIEIYQNTIDGTAYPLVLLNHNSHPTRTRNVYVHDNVMTFRASTTRVGAYAANGLVELFSPEANNRFDHNTYRVPNMSGAYWAWDGKVSLTWIQWRGYGQDGNGSLELVPTV